MDISFITDISNGFELTFGSSPQAVYGNRAMLNRFEIVMLTRCRQFLQNDTIITDNFGGNAPALLSTPKVLNNLQSIAGSMGVIVDQTVGSILEDQWQGTPDTEKLKSASLVDIEVNDGVVFAIINVVPVKTEKYSNLRFRLPITRK